jgi:hypothetical protein
LCRSALDLVLLKPISWGYDDTPNYKTVTGYVVINKVVWLTTSWQAAARGFITVEIDIDNCSATNIRQFDAYASTSNADALAGYIVGLPATTILIGVNADEAPSSLTKLARNTLLAIDVNVTQLAYRGKVAFISHVGRSSATVELMPPYGCPTTLNAVISRT